MYLFSLFLLIFNFYSILLGKKRIIFNQVTDNVRFVINLDDSVTLSYPSFRQQWWNITPWLNKFISDMNIWIMLQQKPLITYFDTINCHTFNCKQFFDVKMFGKVTNNIPI